jgi:PD-(D/E)XK nuclease superfamily protein
MTSPQGAALTHLPVSGTRRAPTIDFTSLSTLASCQKRWHYKYVQQLDETPTTAMSLGHLMHLLFEAWWRGGDWQPVLQAEVDGWQLDNPGMEFVPEYMDRAAWLMERYVTVYGPERFEVEVVGVEVPFRVRLPGKYGWLVGRIDGLEIRDNHLWVVERKTGGDFSKLDTYTWDPQTSLYYWAARQLGYEPWGIMVDFTKTYRWKRGDRPPAESFERRWLDRNDKHLEMAIEEAKVGLDLARAIITERVRPLRNPDRHCQWCPYQGPCVSELAFGEFALPDSYEMVEK